jgi:hypothetical protein
MGQESCGESQGGCAQGRGWRFCRGLVVWGYETIHLLKIWACLLTCATVVGGVVWAGGGRTSLAHRVEPLPGIFLSDDV